MAERAHYHLEDRSATKHIWSAMDMMTAGDVKTRKQKENLVVCGSVFLMAEAWEACGVKEPGDSPHIAEVAGAGVNRQSQPRR